MNGRGLGLWWTSRVVVLGGQGAGGVDFCPGRAHPFTAGLYGQSLAFMAMPGRSRRCAGAGELAAELVELVQPTRRA